MSDTDFDLDELFLIGTFLHKPPAEMQIVPLQKDAILRAMARCQTPGRVRKEQHGVKPRDAGSDPSVFRLFE